MAVLYSSEQLCAILASPGETSHTYVTLAAYEYAPSVQPRNLPELSEPGSEANRSLPSLWTQFAQRKGAARNGRAGVAFGGGWGTYICIEQMVSAV